MGTQGQRTTSGGRRCSLFVLTTEVRIYYPCSAARRSGDQALTPSCSSPLCRTGSKHMPSSTISFSFPGWDFAGKEERTTFAAPATHDWLEDLDELQGEEAEEGSTAEVAMVAAKAEGTPVPELEPCAQHRGRHSATVVDFTTAFDDAKNDFLKKHRILETKRFSHKQQTKMDRHHWIFHPQISLKENRVKYGFIRRRK